MRGKERLVLIDFDGESLTPKELAAKYNVSVSTLYNKAKRLDCDLVQAAHLDGNQVKKKYNVYKITDAKSGEVFIGNKFEIAEKIGIRPNTVIVKSRQFIDLNEPYHGYWFEVLDNDDIDKGKVEEMNTQEEQWEIVFKIEWEKVRKTFSRAYEKEECRNVRRYGFRVCQKRA